VVGKMVGGDYLVHVHV
jgi:hypothetical protein